MFKMVKTVRLYVEKVAARFDPDSNSVLAVITTHSTLKSWQPGKYVNGHASFLLQGLCGAVTNGEQAKKKIKMKMNVSIGNRTNDPWLSNRILRRLSRRDLYSAPFKTRSESLHE